MKKIVILATVLLIAMMALQAKDKSAAFQKEMDAMRTDQKLCSGPNVVLGHDKHDKFVKEQEALVRHPDGKKYIGDEVNGRKLFADARRGNCYACHCGESSEVGCGNIGPSLKNFSKNGLDPDFVYQRVYNSWSILPCSVMPRFGVHNQLSPAEIADIVAYLLKETSPLNK